MLALFSCSLSLVHEGKNWVVCHMWQSWVEIEHYSVTYLSRLKHCSAELLLRAGLMLMLGYLITVCSEYEPCP